MNRARRTPRDVSGYTSVPDAVITDRSLSREARFLSVLLRAHTPPHGDPLVDYPRLGELMGVDEALVCRAIAELRGAGLCA